MLSIDSVCAELQDPDAQAWAHANGDFFDPDDLTRLAEVSKWVNGQVRFNAANKQAFLARADPRLIAHALAGGHIVVTHEQSAPTGAKVKIPDVCKALGVDCQNTFQVLDQLKARFILEEQP